MICLTASTLALVSASAVDSATVDCNLDIHDTKPPANTTTINNGTVNLGGGGGGGGFSGGVGTGGTGGSGVVILRYLTSVGTITIGAGLTGSTATDGSHKVTTITAGTGNVSWA